MNAKTVATGLFMACILSSAGMAQPQPRSPQPNDQQPLGATGAPAASTGLVAQGTTGVLRTSDLIGRNVAGSGNEDIGEIEDIILDSKGQIAAFVIEVEEALGLGDREIAVPAFSFRIDPIDTTASTGTIQGAGLPASTAEGQQTREDSRISKVLTPDRITLTIPAEQLKSMPAFEDDDD
ncbi:PRC-barrel domain-containing protein [Microvirga makkahensis]|uniref:PRC-barrel domain-containing protein n=1 Tax=Microvirga makkahensis TaxID=1128670 RepID=A0A7X3MMV1_9HYPH|nr:PRC-barrel domain-containing protein [Microvirga makkahensis]MXQ09969.1 hypothetical protein [Microvirga makkahensis]